MLICVSEPTLLTQNQSFVLLPKVPAVAVGNGLPNTGFAAVYELSDVGFFCLSFFSSSFLNCLNIILLNSCNKAVVSNLIKWCFHPSGFNKAVSRSYCEAEDLLWLFMFAWLALTEYHLWSDDDYKLPIVELLVLGVLLIDLGLGPLHKINSCTLWLCVSLCERGVWLLRRPISLDFI